MVSAAADISMHMDGWGAGAWLVRSFGEGGSRRILDAGELLERRLAEGDIAVEEYRARREALSDEAPRPAG